MNWAAEWKQAGLNGPAHSDLDYFGVIEDKRNLFSNELPFWLSIGPICWEGTY